jgi:hypothetical protein
MEPGYWRSLRRLKAKKGAGPGTIAKLALHEYLYREDPVFRQEQDMEAEAVDPESVYDTQETSFRLNEGE